MRRKNIPLILVAIVSAILFLRPTLPEKFPAWPGYRVTPYIRVNAPLVALTHVRIVDGTGATPVPNSTVIFSHGKIQFISGSDSTPVPAEAEILELPGYTVIPGLVGMHDHMFYGGVAHLSGFSGWAVREMSFAFPRLYLASGVTTLRTAGAIDPAVDLRLKNQIDQGRIIGPKMFVTGPYLDNITADQARMAVETWADKGATSFKAYTSISRAALASAIEAAHKRGFKVTGHLCTVGFREAVLLGVDNLEHGLLVDTDFDPQKIPDTCPPRPEWLSSLVPLDVESVPVQDLIGSLVAHHVAVTSTLPVFETFVPHRAPDLARILEALQPSSRADYLDVRAEVNRDLGESPFWRDLLKKEMQFERNFVKAGGVLLAGEDPTGNGGNLAGFGDQREVELLVEAGFTPVQAIQIATANGAAFLGASEHIGSLLPGKQADLVVIHGDPSTTIADIEKVEIVFKDGVGYDSAKLIKSVRNSVGLHWTEDRLWPR
jgi:imidazolonepropionase-like amidohydrolase